jgi:hypothetical protein
MHAVVFYSLRQLVVMPSKEDDNSIIIIWKYSEMLTCVQDLSM